MYCNCSIGESEGVAVEWKLIFLPLSFFACLLLPALSIFFGPDRFACFCDDDIKKSDKILAQSISPALPWYVLTSPISLHVAC